MQPLQRVLIGLSLVLLVTMVGGEGDPEALAHQPRFVDNGDGTITDNETELQWEKKVSTCPDLHCVNDRYTWSNGMLGFILGMNNFSDDGVTVTGLGGYTDWRLPNIVELQTILDRNAPGCGTVLGGLCIDPIFGPTAEGDYWSSSTIVSEPIGAWIVRFSLGGIVGGVPKESQPFISFVRAVRGGRESGQSY